MVDDPRRWNRSALLDELQRAGADVSRPRSIRCPWHDDRNPSAGVYERPDGVWAFKCHVCDLNLDVFDVRARVQGRPLAEVMRDARVERNGTARRRASKAPADTEFGAMARRFEQSLSDSKRAALASELGVVDGALRRTGVGVDENGLPCWPEWDGRGNIIGVVRRGHDGRKLAVKGAKRGLVLSDGGCVPDAPDGAALLVCEGASDTWAALSLGLPAIGRPSAKGGGDELCDLLGAMKREVIVLGDDDDAGREGAEAIAQQLVRAGVPGPVAWAVTPGGDLRDWLASQDVDLGDDVAAVEAGERLVATLRWQAPAAPSPPPHTRFEPAPARRSFPTDRLPPVLGDVVRDGAYVHQVDESMIALPVLATVGAAIGAARCVVCGGQRRLPVVWAAVVAISGSNKSEAMQEGVRPLLEIEREAGGEYASALADYERMKAAYDAKTKAERMEADEPERPSRRRFRTSDFTVEAVHALLDENRRGILVARNELSALFDFGRYSKSGRGAGEVATVLEWFDGRPTAVDRKSADSPPILLSHTCVSIVGTITPKALTTALTDERFEQGLAARFLLTRPEYRRKRFVTREVDPGVRAEFEALVLSLTELDADFDDDQIRPRPLYLSDEATALYRGFFEAVEERLAGANEVGDDVAAALLSKIGSYAPRLALIAQLASDSASGVVEGTAMESAIELAWWFEAEARRVY